MSNVATQQKLKIRLEDYDYKRDIDSRLLMQEFSSKDIEVLEEILYSPLQIPVKQLVETLDIPLEELTSILVKLSNTGLFQIDELTLIVNKEMRKYFEFQILKFDNDFKPDMTFLQGLLKKVPIEVLPNWYTTPRTSNNIFDSILEKYLCTPLIYQRHLVEVRNLDPIYSTLMDEVFSSPNCKIPSKELREKLDLSKEEFTKVILFLELSFILCLSYSKVQGKWEEVITPFYEWKEYLQFQKTSDISCVAKNNDVEKKGAIPFCFVHAMTALLKKGKKGAFSIHSPEIVSMGKTLFDLSQEDMIHAMKKADLLQLAKIENDHFVSLDEASYFIALDEKEKAMFVYKHPYNYSFSLGKEKSLPLKKHIHEAVNTLSRLKDKSWVFYSEFEKGVINPFCLEDRLALKKEGKSWGYHMPKLKEEDQICLKALIFELLFEASIIDIGQYEEKTCICLTEFGMLFFEE
jgi:hypothetical protein